MAYFSSKSEMFTRRAQNYRNQAGRQWAMAKNGGTDAGVHYGAARKFYAAALEADRKAEAAEKSGNDTVWH